jgi:hypothetical protein
MNRQTDQEQLLTDVLREEAGAGFYEALLGETLRLARRRRQVRLVQRVGGVFAILAVTAAIAFWWRPHAPVMEARAPAQNYKLTLSQPLPASCVVSSQPLRADQVVASTVASGVIYTSTTGGLYRVLGDDELLALAPLPAALVRRGPHEAELVLVSAPAETDGQQN